MSVFSSLDFACDYTLGKFQAGFLEWTWRPVGFFFIFFENGMRISSLGRGARASRNGFITHTPHFDWKESVALARVSLTVKLLTATEKQTSRKSRVCKLSPT